MGKKRGGETTKTRSSYVWEEKGWQRGRASSSKNMSAGALFFSFFLSFFCLGNLFLWVPGTAAQNQWNECKECIVWERHRSVVTFFSALASRARALGNEGDRVGKVQTPLSLCLSLDSYNPVEISNYSLLFPFAYLSQLYARSFCKRAHARDVCRCVSVSVWCLDFFHAKPKVCFAYIRENIGIHITTYERASKEVPSPMPRSTEKG